MKISKEELLQRIAERCPEEVEVFITSPQAYLEDIKIYGLKVPRSELDQKLLAELPKSSVANTVHLAKLFLTTKEKVAEILEELAYLPGYSLTCSAMKPDMGEIGCDTVLGTFHDELTIRYWLSDLGRVESKYCTDIFYKAEQVQEYRWFLECPNCYALRLLDLEALPFPTIWSKGRRQSINNYYGRDLVKKYEKKRSNPNR